VLIILLVVDWVFLSASDIRLEWVFRVLLVRIYAIAGKLDQVLHQLFLLPGVQESVLGSQSVLRWLND